MARASGEPEPLRLDELGWRQFLDLCMAVLEQEAGVSPGSWVSEEDRHWHVTLGAGLQLPRARPLPGPCRVEVQWISNVGGTPTKALVAEQEMRAMHRRLDAEHWVKSVALFSNYPASVADDEDLAARLGLAHIERLGPGWLSGRVDDSASLRRAMPSLLSLADLDRWVTPDLGERSTLDLRAARALAEVFVPTAAYRRALEVLDAHHFAVLTGPPEMGKTSIARMIALSQMSSGWEAFECTAPEDIQRAFDGERSQLFVADDAFGSTEYRPEAGERWAREMERLLRMMDERHLLIWTSRPAPLHAGLRRINRERGAERFPQPGEVLVDASGLSLDEKVLILLRHAKANAASETRQGFRHAGYAIVSHPHFTPERIRRLASSDLGPAARLGTAHFEAVVEWHIQTPTEAMAASFNALSDEHRALLIAMLDAAPGPLEERELAHLTRLHRPGGLSRAPMELVDRLTDHFLRVTDTLKVDWVHPSWRDLVIEHLRQHAEAREAFLGRCTIEGMLLAISGAGGATGARTLPLLITDRDWDLLTDGVVGVVRRESDSDAARVLYALIAAARESHSMDERRRDELRALIEETLRALDRRCQRDAGPIDVDLIAAWSSLAGAIGGRVSPSCVERTWSQLLPRRRDMGTPEDVESVIEWLELGEVLRRYAPELARGYGFPDDQRMLINSIVHEADLLLTAGRTSAPHRERLIHLLRQCRRTGICHPARTAELDELIWEASREPAPDPPAPAVAMPEASLRAHVERILQDL